MEICLCHGPAVTSWVGQDSPDSQTTAAAATTGTTEDRAGVIGETGLTKIGLVMAILANSIAPHPHTQTILHLHLAGTVVVLVGVAGVELGSDNTDKTKTGTTTDIVDTMAVSTEVTEVEIKYFVKFYQRKDLPDIFWLYSKWQFYDEKYVSCSTGDHHITVA